MPFFFWPRPFYVPLMLGPDRFSNASSCPCADSPGFETPPGQFHGRASGGVFMVLLVLVRPTPCLSELAAAQRPRAARLFSRRHSLRHRKPRGAASPPEGDCWELRSGPTCTPSRPPNPEPAFVFPVPLTLYAFDFIAFMTLALWSGMLFQCPFFFRPLAVSGAFDPWA